MFKVNLEKEIIRQNKSLVTDKELLLVKEYDRLGDDVTNSDALQRVFGSLPAKSGAKIKLDIAKGAAATRKFDQSRVFHISQIEKICKKYHLRFLRSGLFNGSIDKELPGKISAFEIAYEVNMTQNSSFICAPAKSFNLQERPKDPLLFHKINDNYFYLVHKWGNDLSIFRRAYMFLSNGRWCFFVTLLIAATIILPSGINMTLDEKGGLKTDIYLVSFILLSVFTILFMIFNVASLMCDGELIRFVRKNDWRSETKD